MHQTAAILPDNGVADLPLLFPAVFVGAGADEYRWEQEWQVGDTVIWENRGGLMHTGRLDYPEGERRIMIRCTIGNSPIEAYQG